MDNLIVESLEECTGYDSGAVIYEDAEAFICNWVGISGLPRIFSTGLIGLGEEITAAEALLTEDQEDIAIDLAKKEGDLSPIVDKAYNCGDAIVVTFKDWN